MKILFTLLTLSLLSNSIASANPCRDSHLERARRISGSNWQDDSFKAIGSTWMIMGVAAIPANHPNLTLPAAVFAAGGATLAKSIAATVRAPRYELIEYLLNSFNQEDTASHSTLESFPAFQKAKREILETDPTLTNTEIAISFIDGIKSGEFCKANGKPFSFRKMVNEIINAKERMYSLEHLQTLLNPPQ